MTTSPTPVLRNELSSALGSRASAYWETLNRYLTGRISRLEYDEQIRECVDSPPLVQLHNQLIMSILGSSSHHTPLTPPPDAPGKVKPTRKRRRALPYQSVDPNDPSSLRSTRLKKWTVGMGRAERERVKALAETASRKKVEPRREADEIARERGVALIPEGKDQPAGSYMPVSLASMTRSPNTLQHIMERVALISAQHNLKAPAKTVASLMMLACEAKLKHVITQTLSLTSTSHAITSIQPATINPLTRPSGQALSASAFETLFTLSPFVLPGMSAGAAAMRLTMGDHHPYSLSGSGFSNQSSFGSGSGIGLGIDLESSSRKEIRFKERHVDDPRWQILAVLADRSAVRDALLDSKAVELLGAS